MSCNVVIVTKIGKNYGAVLQAFALKKAVEKTGASVSIVNYALPNTMQTYSVLPKVSGISTFISFLKSLRNYRSTKKSVRLFLEFRDTYLNFTDVYYTYEQLKNNPPKADVYITGSDQVWNPCINFDPAYYLMFGEKDTVRAAYAASIGLDSIPKEYKDEFVHRLSNIQYKSVREDLAQSILHDLGIEACVSLDPTLLHNKQVYDEIALMPQLSKPYVLLYLLIMPENVEKYIDAIRKKYKGCVIVNIPGSPTAKKIGDLQMGGIGPREFLGLIKNAKAVLTSSFHGTVFSILYEKDFMSILPNNTGIRIKNLLNKLDLNHRVASSPENVCNFDNEIDYSKVNANLEELKRDSYNYLFSVFKKVKED